MSQPASTSTVRRPVRMSTVPDRFDDVSDARARPGHRPVRPERAGRGVPASRRCRVRTRPPVAGGAGPGRGDRPGGLPPAVERPDPIRPRTRHHAQLPPHPDPRHGPSTCCAPTCPGASARSATPGARPRLAHDIEREVWDLTTAEHVRQSLATLPADERAGDRAGLLGRLHVPRGRRPARPSPRARSRAASAAASRRLRRELDRSAGIRRRGARRDRDHERRVDRRAARRLRARRRRRARAPAQVEAYLAAEPARPRRGRRAPRGRGAARRRQRARRPTACGTASPAPSRRPAPAPGPRLAQVLPIDRRPPPPGRARRRRRPPSRSPPRPWRSPSWSSRDDEPSRQRRRRHRARPTSTRARRRGPAHRAGADGPAVPRRRGACCRTAPATSRRPTSPTCPTPRRGSCGASTATTT